jgi:hypothetical protein
VRYEVVTVSDGSRFEFEPDEPLEEGDTFARLTMIYRVVRVLPGGGDFDAVVQVEHVGGPGESGSG